MVFVKTHLSLEMFEYKHFVTNIIKLQLIINNTAIIIFCVYRSPSIDISEFLTNIDIVY